MRTLLAVQTLGYLVPRTRFSGRIHSVFEQACNLECDVAHGRGLLTLSRRDTSVGPTTLRLASDELGDLRNRFGGGEPRALPREPVAHRPRRALFAMGRGLGAVRHPGVRRDDEGFPSNLTCTAGRIGAHCRRAHAQLAAQRGSRSSVIDAQAAPVAAALADACRNLDTQAALAQAQRLIGWGEGLTPAGDDFLVGLLAALHALMQNDPARRHLHDALAAQIASHVQRTTPIAAHYLLLGAAGHFSEPLLGLRNALFTQADASLVDTALRRALAVGATSGADTVAGLLAGLSAWLAPCTGRTIAA